MNKFEYINENLEFIRIDINLGIGSTSVLNRFESYKIYRNYLKEGFKKGQSAKLAAKDLKVSLHFIQRVRKDMEREIESEAETAEDIRLLRKQLAKKGYSLVGNDKKGYAIKDKYSVTKNVSSLADANRFLTEFWKIHFEKIFKKMIPPIR